MPAAFTATRTSPGPGCGSGRSWTFRTSGPPCSVMTRARKRSGGVTLRRPRAALLRLDLAVLGRRVRHERFEEVVRGVRDLVDGAVERLLVRLRRLVVAADLADVLESRVVDLVGGGGGLEVVEWADVSAHAPEPRGFGIRDWGLGIGAPRAPLPSLRRGPPSGCGRLNDDDLRVLCRLRAAERVALALHDE